MIIAIVGAESTGKSWLADALAQRLNAETELRCVTVPEWLRTWCEAQGRTPRREEQAEIAAHQARLVRGAALDFDVVIADTTPLMTAVYSDLVFGDRSLYPLAQEFHSSYCTATLLTSLEVPWVPDGLQRDGPRVRVPVDSLIREALATANVPWSLVSGIGMARLESALEAVGGQLQPAKG